MRGAAPVVCVLVGLVVDPYIVLSPHLDDAVLSCGQLMAGRPGARIVTVFSAAPHTLELLTPYDEGCGFLSSWDAVDTRKIENARACAVLAAEDWNGVFLDGQYHGERTPHEIKKIEVWMADVFLDLRNDGGNLVVAPIGIEHPDHLTVTLCARRASTPDIELVFYDDLPGAMLYPQPPARDGMVPFFPGTGDPNMKRAAAYCYRSQLKMLKPEWNWMTNERYWKAI